MGWQCVYHVASPVNLDKGEGAHSLSSACPLVLHYPHLLLGRSPLPLAIPAQGFAQGVVQESIQLQLLFTSC